MGRILVRGEHGHGIVDELAPLPSEPVVDKPGKGSFYATDLDAILQAKDIRHLVVTGVTTEVCVTSTVREANDRGYDCLVLSDCVASYFPEFHRTAIEMIKAQGGIFGWVAPSERVSQRTSVAADPGLTPHLRGQAMASSTTTRNDTSSQPARWWVSGDWNASSGCSRTSSST